MGQNQLLKDLRDGKTLTLRMQLLLIVQLSIPGILAQISEIIMEYIDASMVGSLGADASASIGLIASTTWLMGGIGNAVGTGFSVQIAQYVGAGNEKKARDIFRQGIVSVLVMGALLGAVGAAIHAGLPVWLGGEPSIAGKASDYFLIFSLTMPVMTLLNLVSGALQCSGNMTAPSILLAVTCILDVVFNFFTIFPTRQMGSVTIPGVGLGVAGAALGTTLAEVTSLVIGLIYIQCRSRILRHHAGEKLRMQSHDIAVATKIAVPIAFESSVLCAAQITCTAIVAPLGTLAIAANSLAVTAESLCYMPGYGIGSAATTLIGQSIGAGRKDLVRRLGWLTTLFGAALMAGSGALMFAFAPQMIGLLTPDAGVRSLGASVLRIEAFAEPMFGASIVAGGVFRGAGDTLIPSCMSLFSMWAIRIPLAAFLAPRIGLRGVWIAMCTELCFRGVIFLIRLAGHRWSGKELFTGKTAEMNE